MPTNHELPFYQYLSWLTKEPVDDYKWWREIQKYLLARPDQKHVYKLWLQSGDCLSEYYKLFIQ
jgi:hypothetical protein